VQQGKFSRSRFQTHDQFGKCYDRENEEKYVHKIYLYKLQEAPVVFPPTEAVCPTEYKCVIIVCVSLSYLNIGFLLNSSGT
jgi:hypothetical protein